MQGDLCSNDFEIAYMVVTVLLFPLLGYSGFKVYNNEDGDDKEISFSTGLSLWSLGFLSVFVTNKYLNSTGKKWRPYFIVSFVLTVLAFVGSSVFGICS